MFPKVSKKDLEQSLNIYNNYYFSNLNGQYYTGEKIKTPGGIVWSAFQGLNSSLKFTQMMIRTKEN